MNYNLVSKILLMNTLINMYIKLRQFFALNAKQSEVNKKLMSPEEYKKAVRYNKARCFFTMVCDSLEFLKDIFIINNLESFYIKYLSHMKNPDIWMLIYFMLFNSIFSIPINMFHIFVLESYFGFNKTTIQTFVKDNVIGLCISSALTYIIGNFCIYIIKKNFPYFYIILWIFFCVLIFIMQSSYLTLIAPLFNKFKPLDDNDLKNKVYDLANKVGFKTDKILVMDGSRRSTHGNAFFTGMGKLKNIVFFDTILEQLNHDEIIGVLSHELGHWMKWHTLFLMSISFIYLFVYLYLFNYIYLLENAFPVSIIIIYYNYVLNLISVVICLLQNSIVRCFERQADRFAVDVGHGEALYNGLIKISNKNSSAPVYDPLYSCFVNSHPPLQERLELIQAKLDKNK